MKKRAIILLILGIMSFCACVVSEDTEAVNNGNNLPEINGFPVVSTNQTLFFNNNNEVTKPATGQDFYGQDAHYSKNEPQYQNNGDGTVTDLVTGLMWQQSYDHNDDGSVHYDDKLNYPEILSLVKNGVSFAGYNDWRLPTIKEMYSLILFSGKDLSPESTSSANLTPFIDNNVFEFAYGDLNAGERLIDMQSATSTVYVSDEVSETVFGVNFADGRIKGYGYSMPGRGYKAFNYLLVRGNTSYGINKFIDNGDGTVTDEATGLMWLQNDNGEGVLWQIALSYAEGKEFAGYSDWRLPDAKELQSIVDYSRSPATSNSAAIDPLFNCTKITNEAGETDYPWYWSSTTHASMMSAGAAVYIAFGRSLGNMQGWIDVHGAGSQRSDPKSGNPDDFSEGRGPQGDAIRILNFVRLVRTVQ